jgi:hypothetical protein
MQKNDAAGSCGAIEHNQNAITRLRWYPPDTSKSAPRTRLDGQRENWNVPEVPSAHDFVDGVGLIRLSALSVEV